MSMSSMYRNLKELLGITTEEHVLGTNNIFEALKLFHEAREKTYQMSFAKRGESGVWLNVARKYDRIDELAMVRFDGNASTFTLIDCLIDVAVYALKWVDLLARLDPLGFAEWVKNVYARDCNISYTEAMNKFNCNYDVIDD